MTTWKRQIEDLFSHTSKLRQAILKRAFEGKLVPQNPNDEPASILVERIRSARGVALARTQRTRQPNALGGTFVCIGIEYSGAQAAAF